METWLEELSADQRFRLLEMEYDVVIRLLDGPNPLLEELLRELRPGSPIEAARQDAGPAEATEPLVTDAGAALMDAGIELVSDMGGGQAFRDAVDRACPQRGKRRKKGRMTPEMTARMEQLFAEGAGSAREIHRKLAAEFGSMPIGASMVSWLKTRWTKQQGGS